MARHPVQSGRLAIPRPHGYGSIRCRGDPPGRPPLRRWPADRFAAVAARLRRAGHDVVITGDCNSSGSPAQWRIRPVCLESSVLAGTLGLLGLVALISDCRLLVCGDTGVGHVATATGTPSVVYSDPRRRALGPRGNGPHIAIWAEGQGRSACAAPFFSGLLVITVSRVIEAVDIY